MEGLTMNRVGPTVGLARALPRSRSASRLCRVRAGNSDAKKPVVYRELPGVSGKYVVNYTGYFNKQFKKRLLCIDGGGVRGLVPATVLISVEKVIAEYLLENHAEHLPPGITAEDIEVDVADYFDIISGTSVGSIVALYMGTKGGQSEKLLKNIRSKARPGSAQAISDIIFYKSGKVFPAPLFGCVPYLGDLLQQIKLLFAPKFSPDGLEQLLLNCFGEMTLKDAKTTVLVPAFNISNNTALSFWGGNGLSGSAAAVNRLEDFKQLVDQAEERLRKASGLTPGFSAKNDGGKPTQVQPGLDIDPTVDFKLWQIARASAAAPTFFPAASVDTIDKASTARNGSKEPDSYVDGGVIANNPTMQGLTLALSESERKPDDPPPDIGQIAVLSLGTGSALPETEGLQYAGALKWLVSGALIGTMMDGTSNYLQALIDNLFHRLQGTFPEQYVRINAIEDADDENSGVLSQMDKPKNVKKLREIGLQLGEDSKYIIRDYFDLCLSEEQDMKVTP